MTSSLKEKCALDSRASLLRDDRFKQINSDHAVD